MSKQKRQAILPYQIEVVEDGVVATGRAGLPLWLETAEALGMGESIQQHLQVSQLRCATSRYAYVRNKAICSLGAATRSTSQSSAIVIA